MNDVDDITVRDEYPVRPSSMVRPELQRHNSMKEKKKTYTTVLLSFTYFIFGAGVGLYAPLYPLKADRQAVASYIYGPAISCSYLMTLLFYPLASRMVSSITCRQSICTGTLMIGCCRVLFGLLGLISGKLSFILLSFAIQIVEGFGIAMLLVSTFIALFSEDMNITKRNPIWIMAFSVLGISIGPICGEAANAAFGFGAPFYGIGILTVLDAVLLVTLLPEPSQKITHKDLSIISWMKKSNMLIYFIIIFATFNYTGFLAVILEPYLRQFHLNKVFLGTLFSVPLFACGLSAPCWKWLTKKGINSLLLACIASISTFGSLILIVPASFTTLDVSLTNISIALLLQGLGSGGKLACIVYAADRDLKTRRVVNGVAEPLPLVIPTMFAFGTFSGYFSGSVISGFTFHFCGIPTSSYVLYGLETLTVAVAFIYAFKRNYRAPRIILSSKEREPLLDS